MGSLLKETSSSVDEDGLYCNLDILLFVEKWITFLSSPINYM
ncbi:hypothetical protein CNEO4_950059 [Clostridium neonatale]|uniref:Uncharacterized protein n=1 Tax=Clostridium neonatale TaxID=137838 RepID=A0AAD1YGE0_9CLOT|nr:hypothetical protein CNEO2_230007 [Clostridium neonatale]CAI3200703.1 hypothetical protein CNEO2_220015 [Clostridium neonatale]CAI3209768.1 hypothetical protein CNEO2_430007 [Clostridium neonatale]CAI3241033.1 hypothetical protein CNEO2_390014 [Clostridium neonatale]CAI3246582.1 hypothetical protein CNEO2_720014 [Clostridium neonatale]